MFSIYMYMINKIWYFQDLTTFDEQIKLREKIILDKGDTLQPLIVIVGPETDYTIYVYVDGMKYFMQSLIKAVDVCFKLFHVFNANYPKTGQLIWKFIERFIYHIHTDGDPSKNALCPIICNISRV